VVKLFRLE